MPVDRQDVDGFEQRDNTDITAVSMYGKSSVAGDTPILAHATRGTTLASWVVAGNVADGDSNTLSMVGLSDGNAADYKVFQMAFNGATWDRQRGNEDVTILASAARTATVSSSDLTNYNARGISITIDVTVDGAAASVTPTIEVKDALSGKYETVMALTAVASVITTTVLIYPSSLTAAANDIVQVLSAPLQRTWRVTMTHADADSITYSVGGSYIL